jgi:hypothetical protein
MAGRRVHVAMQCHSSKQTIAVRSVLHGDRPYGAASVTILVFERGFASQCIDRFLVAGSMARLGVDY